MYSTKYSEDRLAIFGDKETFHPHIMKLCNVDEQYVRDGIKILMDWYEAQPHLPKYILDWDFIEGFFSYCKFSIEKTKQKIDCYLTVRSVMPEIFSLRDPLHEDVIRAQSYNRLAIVPKLTKDGSRVIHIRYPPLSKENDIDGYNPPLGYNALFMISDLRFFMDQSANEILVFDLANFSMGLLAKNTPVILKRASFIFQNAYYFRLKELHVINLSKFTYKFIDFGKSLLKKKLVSRIYLHENIESLRKHLPSEFLVTDQGGTAGDFDAIAEKSLNLMKTDHWREWFIRSGSELVDESKRPTNTNMYDDFFGVSGSFRKLNLD